VQGFHYSGPLPAASIPAVVERFAQRAALAA
jgi:EAL domain-containing protein (putative c-di-GMP-specific phosphodiesterase class I)